MRRLLLCILLSIGGSSGAANLYLAVVIDDLGNNFRAGERAINLPAPITFAVLPKRPFSEALAEMAHQQGHELMLHQPMANHSGFPLGALGLTPAMSNAERLEVLQEALQSIPYAQGFNNHLGSLLTEDQAAMNGLFAQHQGNLYFLDSVTTAKSTAFATAKEHGWPVTRRDVFLDHEPTIDFVSKQMLYATKLIEEQGHALVIGHPYEATLGYLELALPILQKNGVTLLPVSEYIRRFGENVEALPELAAQAKNLPGHDATIR